MNPQTGQDIFAVSKHVGVFVIIGAILVVVADTPLYPLALGILLMAILYTGLNSLLPNALNQLTRFIGG